ncbi:MAG: DUF2065 domain-containing protein [Desulfovibrionaceae bacterium]
MFNVDWALFLTAAGLAFVLEGAAYFLFAERMPRLLALMAAQPPRSLRLMGLAAVVLGLVVIFLARRG